MSKPAFSFGSLRSWKIELNDEVSLKGVVSYFLWLSIFRVLANRGRFCFVIWLIWGFWCQKCRLCHFWIVWGTFSKGANEVRAKREPSKCNLDLYEFHLRSWPIFHFWIDPTTQIIDQLKIGLFFFSFPISLQKWSKCYKACFIKL